MHAPDPAPTTSYFPRHGWTAANRCGPNGGNCVEVNHPAAGGHVGVRDSKNIADGVLVFDAEQWRSFLSRTRDGAFDLM